MTRRALDRLLRTPGVTVFSIVAIAVAIAATTVVYASIQALLMPPGVERFGSPPSWSGTEPVKTPPTPRWASIVQPTSIAP